MPNQMQSVNSQQARRALSKFGPDAAPDQRFKEYAISRFELGWEMSLGTSSYSTPQALFDAVDDLQPDVFVALGAALMRRLLRVTSSHRYPTPEEHTRMRNMAQRLALHCEVSGAGKTGP